VSTPSTSTERPATEAPVGRGDGAGRGPHGADAVRASPLGVLRHEFFRTVWIAAFFSNVGTWMESVGVRWIVAEQTRSPIMAANLAIAQMSPIFVLGLIGGLTADRVNRKRLLLGTQTALMLIAGVLAVCAAQRWTDSWLLIGISLAQGVTLAFNFPAWQVLTPRLVPRDELTRAIQLNGVQFNLARVVGPAAAGLVMASHPTHGVTALFVLNTLSFLGVLVAVSRTPDAPPVVRRDDADAPGAWEAIREAVGYALGHRGPRAVLLAVVAFSLLAGPILPMLPLIVMKVYGEKESEYGTLVAVMGVGAVLGGLSLRFVPRWYPRHHFIPLAVTLGGAAILTLSACTHLWQALVVMFFCGTFWMWSFNSSMAALQMLVPDRMRGRVMSLSNVVSFGATPVGTMLAGLIAEVVAGKGPDGQPTGRGIQIAIAALAGTLVCAGLAMMTWRTPEVDGLNPGDAGYERRRSLWRGITAAAHRPRRFTAENAESASIHRRCAEDAEKDQDID
jgi:MFS family permease